MKTSPGEIASFPSDVAKMPPTAKEEDAFHLNNTCLIRDKDISQPNSKGVREKYSKVSGNLHQVIQDMNKGLRESQFGTDGFLTAIETFCSNYWKLRGHRAHTPCTQQRLLSALHTFGGQMEVRKHKQRIRVQPTAAARRSRSHSKRPASAGRPSLFTSTRLATTRTVNRNIIPKRLQRVKRRHDLSRSVQTSIPNAI